MTVIKTESWIPRAMCIVLLWGLIGCAATKKTTRDTPVDYPLAEAVLFTSGADTVFADEFLYV